jgi:pimeloyl-ACP methyl ester carboxylesterase
MSGTELSPTKQKAQTHLPPRGVPGTDLILVPAIDASSALLFIHGYAGGPRTWEYFSAMLPQSPAAANLDLLFYNYDGIYSELHASALLFRKIIRDLTNDPGTLLNPALPVTIHRSDRFRYRRFVIAAHSLGAVITRSGLLYALENEDEYPHRCHTIYFAPAHSGAHVWRLAAQAATGLPFLSALLSAVAFKSPLASQLSPGSTDLEELRQRSAAKGTESARPLRVVIAERENIVNNTRFPGDPIPEVIPRATHRSVCKPTGESPDPLHHVESILWTRTSSTSKT